MAQHTELIQWVNKLRCLLISGHKRISWDKM
jgi:hypothetical protein